MNRTPVTSAFLVSIGHEGETLEVEMPGGRIYQYSGVSAEDYAALMAAPSVGKYFAAHIKNGGFAVERVDVPTVDTEQPF